ncbi:MAG: hypothetical protein GY811_21015 [Myxococcales bacterium]|nr:hypothetical protein [Myxococcales bacterium]
MLDLAKALVDELRSDPTFAQLPVRPGARYVEYLFDEHGPELEPFHATIEDPPLLSLADTSERLEQMVVGALEQCPEAPLE